MQSPWYYRPPRVWSRLARRTGAFQTLLSEVAVVLYAPDPQDICQIQRI